MYASKKMPTIFRKKLIAMTKFPDISLTLVKWPKFPDIFSKFLTIPWPGENFVFPWLFPDTWQPCVGMAFSMTRTCCHTMDLVSVIPDLKFKFNIPVFMDMIILHYFLSIRYILELKNVYMCHISIFNCNNLHIKESIWIKGSSKTFFQIVLLRMKEKTKTTIIFRTRYHCCEDPNDRNSYSNGFHVHSGPPNMPFITLLSKTK